MEAGGRPSNKKVWSVISNVQRMGNHIPLSNQQRQIMRRNVFGMTIWNGQPTIWLTINLNDLGNPLCCKVAGIQIPLSIPPALRKKIRKVAATNDPVSSARFFKIDVDAFIEKIAKIGDNGGGI